jgi:predicted PurR-regulated permease PerM
MPTTDRLRSHPERLLLGLLAAFAVVLWLARGVLLPFLLGMAGGYVLAPVVDRLQRHGVPRGAAAGAMVAAAYGVAIVGVVVLGPLAVRQLIDLVGSLPAYARTLYAALNPLFHRVLAVSDAARVTALVTEAAERGAALLGPLAQGLLGRGLAVLNLILLLAITPIVAFYLLRDWPRLVAEIDSWLPRRHADTIRQQVRAVDAVLAGFARGTAIVCATLAVYYATALTLVGLESGLLLGLLAGAVSFVPYLGTLGSAGLAVGVAAFQFPPDWGRVALVFAIFVLGELLNDYVLTPNLVGDKVGLHPLWVLFAILVSGALFGVAGVVIAVPVSAVIGVLMRFVIARYRESDFYTGRVGGPAAGGVD